MHVFYIAEQTGSSIAGSQTPKTDFLAPTIARVCGFWYLSQNAILFYITSQSKFIFSNVGTDGENVPCSSRTLDSTRISRHSIPGLTMYHMSQGS